MMSVGEAGLKQSLEWHSSPVGNWIHLLFILLQNFKLHNIICMNKFFIITFTFSHVGMYRRLV